MENGGWGPNMCGACAVGAGAIKRLLTSHGFNDAVFVMVDDGDGCHCWTEVTVNGGVYVVDVTATQFDAKHPDVMVMLRHKYVSLMKEHLDFNTVKRGRSASKSLSGWPTEQHPKTYKSGIRKLARSSRYVSLHL